MVWALHYNGVGGVSHQVIVPLYCRASCDQKCIIKVAERNWKITSNFLYLVVATT